MRQRAILLLVALAPGCFPELGECDEPAAFGPIYYDENGSPAYPGQALVEVSCANGSFCHTSTIDPAARLGAPAGLDLDVYPIASPDELERLRRARRVAWNLRHEIWWAVDGGHMPPRAPDGDPASLSEHAQNVYTAVTNVGTYRADGAPLPRIADPEGREMLRNWLACGAHVIEATAGASSGIGDVVPARPPSTCVGVDTTVDPANCGGCGIVCGGAQRCVDGACVCSNAELSACGARCVDLQSDVDACGDCATACDAFCADGACVSACPAGTSDCGGSCVDLTSSAAHCGGCGQACGADAACVGGACTCSGGTTNCASGRVADCRDLDADPQHCGGCGVACAGAERCSAGACVCALTDCDGACVDTTTDPAHCGGCRSPCLPGDACVAGTCVGCGLEVGFAADIAPLLDARCTDSGCHGGARPAANLSLVLGRAHGELVGVPASCGGGVLVARGDVGASYLWNKLTGEGICSGTQMPKRGESLPSDELDSIRAWICRGAAND